MFPGRWLQSDLISRFRSLNWSRGPLCVCVWTVEVVCISQQGWKRESWTQSVLRGNDEPVGICIHASYSSKNCKSSHGHGGLFRSLTTLSPLPLSLFLWEPLFVSYACCQGGRQKVQRGKENCTRTFSGWEMQEREGERERKMHVWRGSSGFQVWFARSDSSEFSQVLLRRHWSEWDVKRGEEEDERELERWGGVWGRVGGRDRTRNGGGTVGGGGQ